MKQIEVVAAIIYHNEKLFATQRGYGKFKDLWEFPGGKIEIGESHHQALRREIIEELNTEIEIDKFINTTEYNYPDFHITLHCYLCHVIKGNLTLLEHDASKWITISELNSLVWLPADRRLINILQDKSTYII